mgnify:FL=1
MPEVTHSPLESRPPQDVPMKRGFYTIMTAQFFSSLADNALFVAAIELLRSRHAPEWQSAALVPLFALFYVALALSLIHI